MRSWIIVVAAVCCMGWACVGEEFEITAIEKTGSLTWDNPGWGGIFAVEWAPSPAGPWCRDWSGLAAIVSTQPSVSVSVPMCYRVVQEPLPPEGMVLIPGGTFTMGNCFDPDEGLSAELPLHDVSISAFYTDRTEVTRALWQEVYAWALANGYDFDNAGSGKGSTHPVHMVNWYDAVKWCNARSQRERLDPVYTYKSGGLKKIYKTGHVDIPNSMVDWDANGYRLPTEAEWEYAARGGVAGHRFPWSDVETITQNRANYESDFDGGEPYYPYDVNPIEGYHPLYETVPDPYTSPVGSFAPNGYGLYDMAGNMWEMCWDWFADDWYEQTSAVQPDTRGPVDGTYRVLRGGSWGRYARSLRCALRNSNDPAEEYTDYGFRCVRGF